VIGQTLMQLNLGLQFSIGQLIGKVGTWIVMGGIAIWLTIAFLGNLADSMTSQKAHISEFRARPQRVQ
jgi:hypothetical protein